MYGFRYCTGNYGGNTLLSHPFIFIPKEQHSSAYHGCSTKKPAKYLQAHLMNLYN